MRQNDICQFSFPCSSSYERKSNNKNRIGSSDTSFEEEFCIVDNAFMSLQSISGNFKNGLPHGDIVVTHHNNAEMRVILSNRFHSFHPLLLSGQVS